MQEKIKILILEDDKNDINLILHELKKNISFFEHEIAWDEKSFTENLRNFCPDIILSDYSLPSFSGSDAFDIKQKHCPQTPFIIVSGFIGEENAVELIKKGVTDYAVKDKLLSLPNKISRAIKESKEKFDKAEAEKNLIVSEKRLAEAESIAHLGSWEIDLVTDEEYWSREVYRILGLQPGEITPTKENYLQFIHPDDIAEIKNKISEAEGTFNSFSYSARIIRKDGSQRNIYSNGKFITNNEGAPVREIGILQDITETKKLEEELKALNKELETFIYRASHDLRGPLTSIIGLTTVSKSEIEDKLAIKYLTMIESSAQKLDATLVSLVQSMTMRDMIVNLEEINFDELVNGILSLLKFHAGFSKIKITVNNTISENFKSNKLILTSVFQNLIQNSIKYQNYHNGESYLHISISKKNEGIEIIFEDNGIGIDEFMQSKIFDMYFRGTTAVAGTGLGLYIVKIGIEKLKGTIKLISVKDKGATFVIFLPDLSR
jgi:two-component system sensor histidine kinase UhpB